MKTITEAAKECEFNSIGNQSHFTPEQIFRYGVAFAEQWTKVEDETPLACEIGEWDGKRSDYVLAKNKWGNIYIARTYEGIIDGNKFCDFAERNDTIISHIIEWRPIERY
jgi:hypothetical protein